MARAKDTCAECRRLRRLAGRSLTSLFKANPGRIPEARQQARGLLKVIREHESKTGHRVARV